MWHRRPAGAEPDTGGTPVPQDTTMRPNVLWCRIKVVGLRFGVGPCCDLRFGVGPYCDRMKPTTFVRALTTVERGALNRGLKSADAFTLRRCQILLASAGGKGPAEIGRVVGVTAQAVRDTIRAFHDHDTDARVKKSNAQATQGRLGP